MPPSTRSLRVCAARGGALVLVFGFLTLSGCSDGGRGAKAASAPDLAQPAGAPMVAGRPLGVPLNATTTASGGGPRPAASSAQWLVQTPAGATLHIALASDKTRYFLGENVLVHYTITNRGAVAAHIGFGHDYRAASRSMRYRVRVLSERGQLLRDPDPSGFHMGGLGGSHQLMPGATYVHSLPLMRYAAIEQPGVYGVRVAHDLGWEGDREEALAQDDPRWAGMRIEMVTPNRAQARAVIDAMLAIKSNDGYSVGERRAAWPDFATLRYQPYLGWLADDALAGKTQLIAGLEHSPTSDATDHLIELANEGGPDIALAAGKALLSRMPFPPGKENRGMGSHHALRKHLVRHAWHPRTHPPLVRKVAQQFVASGDQDRIMVGAAMLESIRHPDDFSMVLDALDAELKTANAKRVTANYPRPASAHWALLELVEALLKFNPKVAVLPTRPAMIAAYLIKWGKDKRRPPEYWARAAAWMNHPIGLIRELAVARTSSPLAQPMHNGLPGMLQSGELSLQVHAADAIAALKAPRFANDVMAQAKKAEDRWLLRALERAALASGVPRDTIMLQWAERLDDPTMTLSLFNQLAGLLRQNGGSGFLEVKEPAEAARLKQVWTDFVHDNATAIRAGKVFELSGPEFTEALLLKGMSLSVPQP